MTFEPVIKVGDLLTLVLLTIGGLGFLWAMRGELRMLARDVRLQGEKIDKLEKVVTLQAVQDQRINDLDRRIEELRHGRGFIQRDVDGLWGVAGKVKGTG